MSQRLVVQKKHAARYDLVLVDEAGTETPYATVFDDVTIVKKVFEQATGVEFDITKHLIVEVVFPRN